jgi:hypothetical protein
MHNVVNLIKVGLAAKEILDDLRYPVPSRPSFEDAEQGADFASRLTGNLWVAKDNGPHCFPRYGIVEVPRVGEPVSYAFNGDYYPCGTVAKISKSLKRIETSDGRVFFRRKLSGSWVNGGTWSLVSGHISRWNPEF